MDKINKKVQRFRKIVSIVVILGIIAIVGFIVYSFISPDKADAISFEMLENSSKYIAIGFGCILIFTIFMLIYFIRTGKEYREKLMTSKPEKRFKYIDTFYYYKDRYNSPDEISASMHIAFHIIQDKDSKKYYAIEEKNTNVLFSKVFNETKLLRVDNENKVTTRKDWKEVNYNDEGSFWVDEELVECCQCVDDNVVINYYGENDKLKFGSELLNRNSNYDSSLLTKSIFITGYAKFDYK